MVQALEIDKRVPAITSLVVDPDTSPEGREAQSLNSLTFSSREQHCSSKGMGKLHAYPCPNASPQVCCQKVCALLKSRPLFSSSVLSWLLRGCQEACQVLQFQGH